MRMKVNDPNVAAVASIYDYFNINITYQCYTDILSLDQTIDI